MREYESLGGAAKGECASSTSSSEIHTLLALALCVAHKESRTISPVAGSSDVDGRMAAAVSRKLVAPKLDDCGFGGGDGTGRRSFNTDSLNCPNCERSSSKECSSELRVLSAF